MVFDVELLNLISYCAQQLGVAIGIGAQTVMLVSYLSAMRDGVVDEHEAQFLRATRRVLFASFVFIIASGVVITALHVLGGQAAVIESPAYLFKWLLIIFILLLTSALHVLPETITEGLLGGAWYALFVVHILAPVTTWTNLLTLGGVWIVGFVLVWYGLVYTTRAHTKTVKSSKPFFPSIRWGVQKEDPKVEIKTVAPAAMPAPAPKTYQPITPDPIPRHTPNVKSPAGIATDTPFLPQVPPLMPIPTIPPAPGTVAPQVIAVAPAPVQPVAFRPFGSKEAPALQKPEELPPVAPEAAPEIRLGLHVMPKAPNDIK